MNIRYIVEVEGRRMRSEYSIKDLENDKGVTHNLRMLQQDADVVRRDLGSEVFDRSGDEVYENDRVRTKEGKIGRVVREEGAFFLVTRDKEKTLLSEIEVDKILRRSDF